VNQQIGTMARFYNLHARHGVPKENLHGAAIVHGTGWMAMLTDEAYQRRYGRPNPSKALVEELIANGARFAVCGQTAAFRGVSRDELLPGVQLAISAMTALNVFYAEGYRLQPWR
jgi:intracellular sulfur oxidation DsrE/DsrF family protein